MRRPRTRYQGSSAYHPSRGEPRSDIAAQRPALEPESDGVTDGSSYASRALTRKAHADSKAQRGLRLARQRTRQRP